jgi:hypothetical protein
MTQRVTTDNVNGLMDSLENRIAALERQINPIGGSSVGLISDISNLATGNATAISRLGKGSANQSLDTRLKLIEKILTPVTVLPTSGLIEGQIVPLETALCKSYGIRWMMQWSATADPLGYHWKFVGGAPMSSWVAGNSYFTTVNALTTLQYSNVQDLPIPQDGEWLVSSEVGYIENQSSTRNFMSIQILRSVGDNQNSLDTSLAAIQDGSPNGTSQGGYGGGLHKERSIPCTKGTTVGLRYNQTQYYATVYAPKLSIIPVRLNG